MAAKKTIRVDYLEGVMVKVVSRKKSFDVFITIEAGTYLWKQRESENCWIRFRTSYENRVLEQDIKFKVTNQQYDKTQLLKHFRKAFDLRGGGECVISIFPTFYLPPDLAEKSKEAREWRDEHGKSNPGICTRVGGSGGRRKGSPTAYSNNNAYRPYQGGRCSSK